MKRRAMITELVWLSWMGVRFMMWLLKGVAVTIALAVVLAAEVAVVLAGLTVAAAIFVGGLTFTGLAWAGRTIAGAVQTTD